MTSQTKFDYTVRWRIGGDYQLIASKPGVPLLKKASKDTYETLNRWLGSFVAEPQFHRDDVEEDGEKVRKEFVGYYLCDHGRVIGIDVEPVKGADLRRWSEKKCTPLRKQLDEQIAKLDQQGKKAQRTEQDVYRVAREKLEQLRNMADDKNREAANEVGHYLLKYTLPKVGPRLMWIWAHERADQFRSDPHICASCRVLFAHRAKDMKTPARCSECGWVHNHRNWLLVASTLLLLCLMLGGGAWWYSNGPPDENGPQQKPPIVGPIVGPIVASKLEVEPREWRGPSGSQIRLSVFHTDEKGERRDVTAISRIKVRPQRVARLNGDQVSITAVESGSAGFEAEYKGLTDHGELVVEAPENPDKIHITPEAVALGVGSTERLRVIGEYSDDRKVDLTNLVEWQVADPQVVFLYRGLVEGLAAGQTVVSARYRADYESEYRVAKLDIGVAPEDYTELTLSLTPAQIEIGKTSELMVSAMTAKGDKRTVLESSKLRLRVEPPEVAEINGTIVRALSSGQAKVIADFNGLPGEASLTVTPAEGDYWEVQPDSMRLAVGETGELTITTTGEDPIEIVSSDPSIANVLPDDRKVVGQGIGSAIVTIMQGAHKHEVDIQVETPVIASIEVRPAVLSVAVDKTLQFRVIARTAGDDSREIELPADRVTWPLVPSAEFASFDPATMQLRGKSPTDVPEQISARLNDLEASAQVEVVSAPFELEVTPAGPTLLSAGQSVSLQVWSKHGDDRVSVESEHVTWNLQRDGDASALEFQDGRVTAQATTEARLMVSASFRGKTSNEVEVATSTKDDQVKLSLAADPELVLVGQTGSLKIAAVGASGDVELALGETKFSSSDPAVLAIDEQAGTFRGVAAGSVTVTVTHPAAEASAEATVRVIEPSPERLVIRPDNIKLTVNSRKSIDVLLVSEDGEEASLLEGATAEEVLFEADEPDAVEWRLPNLVGKRPAGPFAFTATYRGMSATATLEVIEPPQGQPQDLRINPDAATLAPLASLTPTVEQKQPNSDEWSEVEPSLVEWKIPEQVHWTAPEESLRPLLTVPETGSGPYQLEAQYAGNSATLTITVEGADQPLAIDDPATQLDVIREPPGEQLPVGQSQRYAVVLRKGERTQHVADVQWPESFSNDYVGWTLDNGPILTARRAGHTEELTAKVGSRSVKFSTTTIAPAAVFRAGPATESTQAAPARLVIETDQPGDAVSVPVGVRYGDFRVMAIAGDGRTRDISNLVTLDAQSDSSPAPITIANREILALHAGTASVRAQYRGITSDNALAVTVSESMSLDKIELVPGRLTMIVGQSSSLRARGFLGGRSIGWITDHAEVVWKSRVPDVAEVNGSNVTAVRAGTGGVTAEFRTGDDRVIISNVAEAIVSDGTSQPGPDDKLVVVPGVLRIESGQSVNLGTDIVARFAGLDVTDKCVVVSNDPTVIQYDEATASWVAGAAGSADMAFGFQDQSALMRVVVTAGSDLPPDARLVLEPDQGNLVVGESVRVRLFLISDSGRRVEKTASGIFRSSNKDILELDGNELVAKAAGQAKVAGLVSGIERQKSAIASFTVSDLEVSDLSVSPSRLDLLIGESQQIEITGLAGGRRRRLDHHPDLQLRAEGPNASSIQLVSTRVQAIQPGQAKVAVSWKGQPVRQIPVTVSTGETTGLRLVPARAQVEEGKTTTFSVLMRRQGREYPVGPRDGVDLIVDDTSIARPIRGLTLLGIAPGTTKIVARLGTHQAAANLVVVKAPRPAPPGKPISLRFAYEMLRLSPGDRGQTPTVFQMWSDGQLVDVSNDVQLTTTAQGVVKLASHGTLLNGLSPGIAYVDATLGEMKTDKPLLVDVATIAPASAYLQVRPSPLVLLEGQLGGFNRVAVVGAGGLTLPVGYSMQSLDQSVVVVTAGNGLRAIGPGRATVVVTAAAPYETLQTRSLVEVVNRSGRDGDNGGDDDSVTERLVLSGPRRITVGGRAAFNVRVERGIRSWPVTNDESPLIVTPSELVEYLPGGSLVAKAAGTVGVRARHRDLVSNEIQLQIETPAEKFTELELTLNRKPLEVGETRYYRLWARPANGGPAQELTELVLDGAGSSLEDPSQPYVKMAGTAATHAPPTVTGLAAGEVVLQAVVGQIRSDAVRLIVVESDAATARVRLRPTEVALHVGEKSPVFSVEANRVGDETFSRVAAELVSDNLDVLEPVESVPGQFRAVGVGTTEVRAVYAGQTVVAPVRVGGNRFLSARLVENSFKPQPDGRTFTFELAIQGTTSEGPMSYRVVRVENEFGADAEQGWEQARTDGKFVSVKLQSPVMRHGKVVYKVTVESRDEKTRTIQRYPFSTRLTTEGIGN